jgi:hypothetical protein
MFAVLMFFFLIAAPYTSFGADWLEKFRGGMKIKPRPAAPLTEKEIAAGLKEALKVSAERVVVQLGAEDGFYADPHVRVQLPEELTQARSGLTAAGRAGLLEELELKLNRAAEHATAQASGLLRSAVEDLKFDRARDLYREPEDAATQYFSSRMAASLNDAMTPIVLMSMAEVGTRQAYSATLEQYRLLALGPDIKEDLTGYVVSKSIEGIFYYLAREEAGIRKDPLKRTTELLQQVFGR